MIKFWNGQLIIDILFSYVPFLQNEIQILCQNMEWSIFDSVEIIALEEDFTNIDIFLRDFYREQSWAR